MALELHVYDFDGTLFRSPVPPEGHSGAWWSTVESLTEPCVPGIPGSDWWIHSTVASAKSSASNPEVYSVLMTGRPAKPAMRYRVHELLRQAGLGFDEVHLSSGGGGTAAFKRRALVALLQRLPEVSHVVFWDDNTAYVDTYVDLIRKMEIDVEANIVRASHMPCSYGVGP